MSIVPPGPDSKTDHPPELLHAAREWIWRHSSQPDGDRWTDDPKYLDWAAANLLVDLAPWLEAAVAVQRVRVLLAEADAYEWNGTTHNSRIRSALGGGA